MKFYKAANNKIFAYEEDGSQDHLIPQDQVSMTLDEVTALLGPSTQQMISSALYRINAAYQASVDALTAGYPDGEIASWPKQEEEARAWTVNNAASTPWMDAAVAARGITKADLAAKIIANADLFTSASGQLSGKRQKLRDQILALGDSVTQAQLDAIQW